jgi:hypothetical protein
MIKTVALAVAASSTIAAENDEDYNPRLQPGNAPVWCVLRATPGSMLFMIGAIKLFRPTFNQAIKRKQLLPSKGA